MVKISMIGYSFEYQGTLGDVGTGRWQRSDQSVSSTTSSEKTIGRDWSRRTGLVFPVHRLRARVQRMASVTLRLEVMLHLLPGVRAKQQETFSIFRGTLHHTFCARVSRGIHLLGLRITPAPMWAGTRQAMILRRSLALVLLETFSLTLNAITMTHTAQTRARVNLGGGYSLPMYVRTAMATF